MARLKLRQYHLWEWETLVAVQQQVCTLVHQQTAQRVAALGDDQRAVLAVVGQQAQRLKRLVARQRQARQQLRARQLAQLAEVDQGADQAPD